MMRELYRQSGLFRVGVFSLAGSVVFALVVVGLVQRPTERAVSAEPQVAATTAESSGEEVSIEGPTRAPTVPEDPAPRTSPTAERPELGGGEQTRPQIPRKSQSEPRQASRPAPPSGSEGQAQPAPAAERRREPPESSGVARRGGREGGQEGGDRREEGPAIGDRGGLPLRGDDWPGARRAEVEAASEPRDYGWTSGAVMTLSSQALGVSDAPVYGNDSPRSLERGVVHVPETSLPWERGRQKNVYLAAHRLGWPGTESRLIFYNLDDLEKGDKVSVEDRRGDTYRYRVTEKLIVDPWESWVMGEVKGEDILSLQTCTPIPSFHKRLVIRAERI